MKNIKDRVYAGLVQAFGEDHVSDVYPTNWAFLPAVQFTEEENRNYEPSNNGEDNSYIRYRVDIWDNRSTSAAAVLVDQVMGAPKEEQQTEGITPMGFIRTSCSDTPDPSNLKHKVIRYEGIISMDDDSVAWPG